MQDITSEAKEIFGDIVVSAVSERGSNNDKYDFDLDMTADDVLIKFSNGKSVLIGISEWACIKNVDYDDHYKYMAGLRVYG